MFNKIQRFSQQDIHKLNTPPPLPHTHTQIHIIKNIKTTQNNWSWNTLHTSTHKRKILIHFKQQKNLAALNFRTLMLLVWLLLLCFKILIENSSFYNGRFYNVNFESEAIIVLVQRKRESRQGCSNKCLQSNTNHQAGRVHVNQT